MRMSIRLFAIFSCNDKVEACSTAPEVGYTGAYVPMASTPLDDMYDATLISGDDRDVIGSDFSVDCTLYLGELETAMYFPVFAPLPYSIIFHPSFRFSMGSTVPSMWVS